MKRLPEKLVLTGGVSRCPENHLLDMLYEANTPSLYQQFYTDIKERVDFLEGQNLDGIHCRVLENFFPQFEKSFDLWKELMEFYGGIPPYPNWELDLLNIGMWDFVYMYDQKGDLSPFGPWLYSIGQYFGRAHLGILLAFEQQLNHHFKENLVKGQTLSNALYQHFLNFIESSNIKELKPDHDNPPLIQLYQGGAVTCLKDIPVPTIIAMNQGKAGDISGFSALPHEFGHDISGTFNGAALVEEIIQKVDNLGLPYGNLWKYWIEECFADAIGVAIIGEGEIFSLANIFCDFFTNIIFADESGKRPDEHPNRLIRVLLTIEVGRLLSDLVDIDPALLDKTESEWIEFSKGKNTLPGLPNDKIYDETSGFLYPVEDFVQGIKPVAQALVDTPYTILKGKKVKDIFADFKHHLAGQLRASITEKRWLPQT